MCAAYWPMRPFWFTWMFEPTPNTPSVFSAANPPVPLGGPPFTWSVTVMRSLMSSEWCAVVNSTETPPAPNVPLWHAVHEGPCRAESAMVLLPGIAPPLLDSSRLTKSVAGSAMQAIWSLFIGDRPGKTGEMTAGTAGPRGRPIGVLPEGAGFGRKSGFGGGRRSALGGKSPVPYRLDFAKARVHP